MDLLNRSPIFFLLQARSPLPLFWLDWRWIPRHCHKAHICWWIFDWSLHWCRIPKQNRIVFARIHWWIFDWSLMSKFQNKIGFSVFIEFQDIAIGHTYLDELLTGHRCRIPKQDRIVFIAIGHTYVIPRQCHRAHIHWWIFDCLTDQWCRIPKQNRIVLSLMSHSKTNWIVFVYHWGRIPKQNRIVFVYKIMHAQP